MVLGEACKGSLDLRGITIHRLRATVLKIIPVAPIPEPQAFHMWVFGDAQNLDNSGKKLWKQARCPTKLVRLGVLLALGSPPDDTVCQPLE